MFLLYSLLITLVGVYGLTNDESKKSGFKPNNGDALIDRMKTMRSISEWTTATNSFYADWDDAFNNQNFCALADLYTEDCIILPPSKEMITGKLGRLRDLVNRDLTKWPKSQETIIEMDGFITEDYAITLHREETEEWDGTNTTGKGVRLFTLVNGEPKIKMAIWNSNK